MFQGSLIDQMKEEIVYLRGMVKDLQDRLMSLNESSFLNYKMVVNQEPGKVEVLNELTGTIESMEAKTAQEVIDKEKALQEVKELLGG